MNMASGYHDFKHGKDIDAKSGGLDKAVGGTAQLGGGIADGVMAATGTESLALTEDVARFLVPGEMTAGGLASVAGPALGAFATGMSIGHYGDEEAKKLGVFHDAKGNAEGASDWASDKGTEADAWATNKFHSKTLGTVAGLAGTGLAGIAGGVVAGESAVAGAELAVGHAAHKLWDWL